MENSRLCFEGRIIDAKAKHKYTRLGKTHGKNATQLIRLDRETLEQN